MLPDLVVEATSSNEEKPNSKWLSLLEKVTKTAEKVITENPGIVLK